MITFQERFYHLLTLWQVLKAIILPAQAFFSHRSVEALDVWLLVLALRSGNNYDLATGAIIRGKSTLAIAMRWDYQNRNFRMSDNFIAYTPEGKTG